MTADKPDAGRTCKPGCGTPTRFKQAWRPVFQSFTTDDDYCSVECREAGKPLNPSPRPIEPTFDESPPEPCGGRCGYSECNEDLRHNWRRPVERCSCPEATRYKAALERIRDYSDSPRAYDIARRALALGEEE